jgi:hypothetical protein
MIVLLNERSLEQHTDWGACLKLFWQTANTLREHAQLFRDSQFFSDQKFKARFQASLAGVSADLRALIIQMVFTEQHWPCWRPERLSTDEEIYSCAVINGLLVDESLCEAMERKWIDPQGHVGTVSAADSEVGSQVKLTIVKEGTNRSADLANASTVDIVEGWLVSDRGFYDINSGSAPSDFQTVLQRDTARFQKTNRLQRVGEAERRIYREIATGRLYYVDDAHWGVAAHLEVFDAGGAHLGEADILAGVVDASKLVPGRIINV